MSLRRLMRRIHEITAVRSMDPTPPTTAEIDAGTTESHLSALEAMRFVWHFRWHPDHAAMVTYDSARNVVRCECGKTWGK